jgi:hypothetical protein
MTKLLTVALIAGLAIVLFNDFNKAKNNNNVKLK